LRCIALKKRREEEEGEEEEEAGRERERKDCRLPPYDAVSYPGGSPNIDIA
jgi:hypothetical protein